LKIVGLLAQQEYSVEQLAGILGLGASTVSHHLARLAQAGLVSARAESYYNYYRLERGALEGTAQRLLSEEVLRAAVAADLQRASPGNEDVYAQKVLRHYFLPDGRLKTIPAQRKKLFVVLSFIAKDFEPGIRYSERTVNQMLSRYHADTASLRREMIGFRILEREKGEYWRTEEQFSGDQETEATK